MIPDKEVGAYFSTWFWLYWTRRSGELDIPLDATEKQIRWAMVVGCGISATVLPWRLNAIAYIVSLVFACWPNFAYHLARLLRWLRLLAPGVPKLQRYP